MERELFSSEEISGANQATPRGAHGTPPVPGQADYQLLKEAAANCRVCPFAHYASQTVFGTGDMRPTWVFVGEQPGDVEDVQGVPFVGPAGKLFDALLLELGVSRQEAYVTNAVKHFKWEPRGTRRLHKKPATRDINTCRPWLIAELQLLEPRLLVCLGATAAQAVFTKPVRIGDVRGTLISSPYCQNTLVTAHPSSILRAPDEAAKQRAYAAVLSDLRIARDSITAPQGEAPSQRNLGGTPKPS